MPAIADDAITLHYQPFADRQGKIVGFEALMRWHHQKRGPISPEAFIPVFENCGLILQLSRWALRQACIDAVSWKRPLQVSVNLSPVQFEQDDVPALVASILAETGLAPERLELEITEASITAGPACPGLALSALAALGVRLTIDSSAGGVRLPFLLKDHPFSKVKISRQLLQTVDASASARGLVHMILLVGRSLNVPVAANGVETAAQLSFVLQEGCDFLQGFLIGRPAQMPAFAGMTGNVAEDFVEASTRLADGMRLIVPLHSNVRPAIHAAPLRAGRQAGAPNIGSRPCRSTISHGARSSRRPTAR